MRPRESYPQGYAAVRGAAAVYWHPDARSPPLPCRAGPDHRCRDPGRVLAAGPPLPVAATQAPDAFDGTSAIDNLHRLAARYPSRRPGSPADDAMARSLAATLRRDGSYHVRTLSTSTQTVDGERTSGR